MSVTNRVSELFSKTRPQLFDTFDQREFQVCRAINQWLRYRPVRHYFSTVSRLGDGWLWYLVILYPALQGLETSACAGTPVHFFPGDRLRCAAA